MRGSRGRRPGRKQSMTLKVIPSQAVESAGISLITVHLDAENISTVSRLAAQHIGASFAGNMADYLPRSRDAEFLKAMQKSDGCLCIIDVDNDFDLAIETASSLQQLLGERILLVALSSKSNPDRILRAMRAGFAEYLATPIDGNEFSESLLRLRRRWTVARNTKPGRVLAFLGARGGAGATTLAVHLSTFLAQLCGKRVLVVDQHRQLGHVGLYLGLPVTEYNFYDLVRNIDRIDADLLNGYVAHEVNGVDVLPGPDGLFGLTEVPLGAMQQTLRYLRGSYEFVVIDCCHGVSTANEPILAESDQIFLVATPDVPALHDLSRYVDRLLQYNFPAGKVNVLVNRCRSRGEVAMKAVSEAVQLPIAITIPNSSEELITAMNTGKPVSHLSRSEFARQLRKWATSLAGSAPSKASFATSAFAFWKS